MSAAELFRGDPPRVGQSVAERQIELLHSLLGMPQFREWLWNHLSELQPFHAIGPADPTVLAWRVGRQSAAIELLGVITSNYPVRYASMLSETPAWRAAREARTEEKK